MFQQMSDGGVEVALPDLIASQHHLRQSSMFSCYVPTLPPPPPPPPPHVQLPLSSFPPYPLTSPVSSHSPLSPPLMPPCVYPPNNDSVGGVESSYLSQSSVSYLGQSPVNPQVGFVPMSPGSSMYCESPVGYGGGSGSSFPCVMYTMCPLLLPTSSPRAEIPSQYAEGTPEPVVAPDHNKKIDQDSYPCTYPQQECGVVNGCVSAPPCLIVVQGNNVEEGEQEDINSQSVNATNFSENSDGDVMGTSLSVESSMTPSVTPPSPVRSPGLGSPDVAEDRSYENSQELNVGVFGVDGCWYPVPEGTHEKTLTTVMLSSEHSSSEHTWQAQQQHQEQQHHQASPYTFPSMHTPAPLLTYVSPCKGSLAEASDAENQAALSPVSPQVPPLPFYNYFHHLDLPMSILGRPRLLHTLPKDGQMCVEELWVKHMKILFKNLPDEWVLNAAYPGKTFDYNWSCFKDLAKVRFYCRHCNDGWTSMYGVVMFYYKWNPKYMRGRILYQVPGQKCGSCSPRQFELPMWYPEEAQKVITNLYYNIASHCYNLVTPQYIRTRRLGKPLAHHNKLLCQGCCQGVCKIDCKKDDEPKQED